MHTQPQCTKTQYTMYGKGTAAVVLHGGPHKGDQVKPRGRRGEEGGGGGGEEEARTSGHAYHEHQSRHMIRQSHVKR